VPNKYLTASDKRRTHSDPIYEFAGLKIPNWWVVGFGPDWSLSPNKKFNQEEFSEFPVLNIGRQFLGGYVCDPNVTVPMIEIYHGEDEKKALSLFETVKAANTRLIEKTSNQYRLLTKK
jgi:hypothetical protein